MLIIYHGRFIRVNLFPKKFFLKKRWAVAQRGEWRDRLPPSRKAMARQARRSEIPAKLFTAKTQRPRPQRLSVAMRASAKILRSGESSRSLDQLGMTPEIERIEDNSSSASSAPLR